jgi:hypothetical protein
MMLRGAGPLIVGQAPEEAIADITAYMAREGFVVSQSGLASVTFTRHKKPDRELVLFFVLLGARASRLVLGLANTNKPPGGAASTSCASLTERSTLGKPWT